MCNQNLKELYYHCHMHTAMKTTDMQTVPELFNIRYDCQWIVHSLKYLGILVHKQALVQIYKLYELVVVPDYRRRKEQSINI